MWRAVRAPPVSRSLPTYTGLVHRWLYDHAGILHGDLSLSNIMCRTVEGKVHRVLTDLGLLTQWSGGGGPKLIMISFRLTMELWGVALIFLPS